jgi:hypothetical protein
MKGYFFAGLFAALLVNSGCDRIGPDFMRNRAAKQRMQKDTQLALQEERLRLAEEAERRERERVEAEKLMVSLPNLIDARIKFLRAKAEDLSDTLKSIAEDRRIAEKETATIEDRRGLEYTVYNVMTNQDLNRLAVKYTGGDFSALKVEFTEAVRFHKTSHSALAQELKGNAENYRMQVKDVDKSVELANQAAKNAVQSAHANILSRIAKLEKEKNAMALKGSRSTRQINVIDAQLERLNQLLELSGGSTAHVNATLLESDARRKFDRALDEKESRDTAAISESQFKGDMFNAAEIYRGRTIDRLMNAMSAQVAVLSERLFTLETTLETLEESKARMQLMEYADLVKLRDSVMADTRDKLHDALSISPAVR